MIKIDTLFVFLYQYNYSEAKSSMSMVKPILDPSKYNAIYKLPKGKIEKRRNGCQRMIN